MHAATSAPAAAAATHQVALLLTAAGVKPEQVGKAIALLDEDNGLVPGAIQGTWHALSSDRTTRYLTGTTFCRCPARAHCYHQLAAIIRAAADAGVAPRPKRWTRLGQAVSRPRHVNHGQA